MSGEGGREERYQTVDFIGEPPNLANIRGSTPSRKRVYDPWIAARNYSPLDRFNPYDSLWGLLSAVASQSPAGYLGALATRGFQQLGAGAGSMLGRRASNLAKEVGRRGFPREAGLEKFRVRSEYPGPSTLWSRSRNQIQGPQEVWYDLPQKQPRSGLIGLLDQVVNFFRGGAPTDWQRATSMSKSIYEPELPGAFNASSWKPAPSGPGSFQVGRGYGELGGEYREATQKAANDIVSGIRGNNIGQSSLPPEVTPIDLPMEYGLAGATSPSMNPLEQALHGAFAGGGGFPLSELTGGSQAFDPIPEMPFDPIPEMPFDPFDVAGAGEAVPARASGRGGGGGNSERDFVDALEAAIERGWAS